MWWPYLSPLPELPRLHPAGQILYSFLMMIPMSIVSAWIVYSDSLLYPAYAASPRILPLTPLDDQRLGALVMWVPGGLLFVVVASVVFFRWAATDNEARAGMGVRALP
jgi:cytochrome c oxidase assembly factor CtaG